MVGGGLVGPPKKPEGGRRKPEGGRTYGTEERPGGGMPQSDPILSGQVRSQDNVMMMQLVRIETCVQVAPQDSVMAKSFDGAWENRAGKAFRQDPASRAGKTAVPT